MHSKEEIEYAEYILSWDNSIKIDFGEKSKIGNSV